MAIISSIDSYKWIVDITVLGYLNYLVQQMLYLIKSNYFFNFISTINIAKK